MHRPRRPFGLFWRVLLLDALLFTTAAALLLITPIEISAPVTLGQASIVLVGLIAMLAANWVLLHRAFQPLGRLVHGMNAADLLRPGQRLAVEHGDEIGRVVRAFNGMLERLEAERQRSGRRMLEAQEAERASIARDLHDEVGQLLTGVLLQLDAASRSAGASEDLDAARDAVRQALEEVRRISRDLRPETLEELGLVSALGELLSTFERVTGVTVERAFDPTMPDLDQATELAIYRIVQESLTNVARHAEASRVRVVVTREPHSLVVRVRDDGIGIAADGEHGAGLRNMRERAVLIGAALAIRPVAPQGTEVRLEVPLARTARRAPLEVDES